MKWLSNIVETIKGNEDISEIKSSSFRDFLNGDFFTKKFFKKQIWLFAMIFVMVVFYVDNRFYCEKQLYTIIKLEKQLKDLKYESLTISAQLMKITRQSYIIKTAKERGLNLETSKTPPIVIDTMANEVPQN